MRATLWCLWLCSACASATALRPVAPEPRAAITETAEPPRLAPLDCLPSDDDALPAFTVPNGGDEFRRALRARAVELACCELAPGEHVIVDFAPVPGEDRARARLGPPSSFDARRATCLERVLSTWEIVPAPMGDVCFRRLDPRLPASSCTFAPASVRVGFCVRDEPVRRR
jgi:hypothetical protein